MTKQARLKIAIEAYEDAMLRGLCRDGALEVATQPPIGIDRQTLLGAIDQPPQPPPFHEPLRVTLLRTTLIAIAIGTLLSLPTFHHWSLLILLAFFPSLGGHYVEFLFLNSLRPRLPHSRLIQWAARLTTWFLGGIALSLAMCATYQFLTHNPPRRPPWYLAGLAFISIELLVHLILHLRQQPNFYNARG